VTGALTGIKAAATGLIAYSAWKVGRQVLHSGFSWVLAIGAFAAITLLGVNAVWVILAGILLGIVCSSWQSRRGQPGEEEEG
jgi:chromate transporter